MEESELIAFVRRVAEAAEARRAVAFERFEQERREADGRASLAAPEQTVVAGTQQPFLEELGSSIEQARQVVEAAEATEVAEVAEVAEAAAQLGAFEQFEQERRDADRLDEVQRSREWERARQPVIELPNCVVS
jgi:hypothetical protein